MTPYALITIQTAGGTTYRYVRGTKSDVTHGGNTYKADASILNISPPVTVDAVNSQQSTIQLVPIGVDFKRAKVNVVLRDFDDASKSWIVMDGKVTSLGKSNDTETLFIDNAVELDSVKVHTTTKANQIGSGDSYIQVGDPEFQKILLKWGR